LRRPKLPTTTTTTIIIIIIIIIIIHDTFAGRNSQYFMQQTPS